MAKKQKQTEVPSRKHLSRREQEERQKRILFAVVGAAAVVIVLVLAYGAYREYIVEPSSPVALVNGGAITTRQYQGRYLYERFQLDNEMASLEAQLSYLDPANEDQQFLIQYFQQQMQQLLSLSISLPTQVLDDMIDEELILQEAQRRGIVVSAAEVQEEVQSLFGYDPNPPTPEPTPTSPEGEATPTPEPTVAHMTEAEFEANYSEYTLALRQRLGTSEADFRKLFELNVYRRKLQEQMGAEVPIVAEQVRARHILVETEEEAQQVVDRLASGEDFAAVADEVSTDTATEGGDLGWFPRGQMVTEFEGAAFSLAIGQISEPVQSAFGYHIIEVLERDSERPLEESVLESRRARALSDWLSEQRQSEAVQRYWSSAKVPAAR